jgi:hypothetical protein
MKLKRSLSLFRVLLLTVLGVGLLQQASPPLSGFKDHLGFSLMPGANSSPVSFKIVRIFEDPKIPAVVQSISRDEFLRIATGAQPSSANPTNENLFIKHEITQCSWGKDTVMNHMLYKGGWQCSIVDDLWKLRYSEYPFQVPVTPGSKVIDPLAEHIPTKGWAKQTSAPSDGQLNMLRAYGIVFVIDILYGDNAFRLLHDMQDPAWESRYRGS